MPGLTVGRIVAQSAETRETVRGRGPPPTEPMSASSLLRFLARTGLTRLTHEDLVVQAVPLLVTIEDFAQVDQVERQFPDGIPDRIAGHNEIAARQYFLALGQLELIEQQRRRGMRRATSDADGVRPCERLPAEKEPVDRLACLLQLFGHIAVDGERQGHLA